MRKSPLRRAATRTASGGWGLLGDEGSSLREFPLTVRMLQRPSKRAVRLADRQIAAPGGFTADHLGSELKALFDRVAEEPLPDHLTRLADELERRCEDQSLGLGRRRARTV